MHDGTGQQFIVNGITKTMDLFGEWHALTKTEPVVYEVIRVEDGIPLFIEDYIQRMKTSFSLIGMDLPVSIHEIISTVRRLYRVNDRLSGPVKIILGYGEKRFFMVYLMKPHIPEPEGYIHGVKTILMHEVRANPNAKVWNPQLRLRTIEAIKKAGAYEAILVNNEGIVTEGSRSNLFFIQGNKVYTCPDQYILPGITRKKVLDICDSSGVDVAFEAIHYDQINRFEACFLTGTTRKLVPVRLIDGTRFSADSPTLRRLIQNFDRYVLEYIRSRQTGNISEG